MTSGPVEIIGWRRCSIPGLVVGAQRPLRVALLLQRYVSPGISLTAYGSPPGSASLDPWSRGAICNLGRVTMGTTASKSPAIRLSMGLVALDPRIMGPVMTIGLRARRTPVAGSVALNLVLRIVTNL